MTIALCCDDTKSGESITRQLSKLCHVTTESFYNISDFIAKVSGCPDTVMLITQTGALSTETAMAAREAYLVFRFGFRAFILPAEGNLFRTAAD